MLDGRCFQQASIQKTPTQFSQGRRRFGLPTLKVVAGALVIVGEEVLQPDLVWLPEPAGHHLISPHPVSYTHLTLPTIYSV